MTAHLVVQYAAVCPVSLWDGVLTRLLRIAAAVIPAMVAGAGFGVVVVIEHRWSQRNLRRRAHGVHR